MILSLNYVNHNIKNKIINDNLIQFSDDMYLSYYTTGGFIKALPVNNQTVENTESLSVWCVHIKSERKDKENVV